MNALMKASAIAAAAASIATAVPASAAIQAYGPVSEFTAPGEQTYDHSRHHYSREDRRRGYGRDDYRYRSSWRGRDGRYYCKKENGTTGLLIGGAAGALLGREIDGGRDRTAGTVIGAAAGALLGREVDRSDSRCR